MAASSCLSSLISAFLLRLFSSGDPFEEKLDYEDIGKTICLNVFGCGISSLITNRIGRKKALLLVDLLFCVSLIGAFPTCKEYGKHLLSFAMGVSATALPLYVSEGTPRRFAFFCMFLFDVSSTLGGFVHRLTILFFKRVRTKKATNSFLFCFVFFVFLIINLCVSICRLVHLFSCFVSSYCTS